MDAWKSNPELWIISNYAVTALLHSMGVPRTNLISVGGTTEDGIFRIRMENVHLECMITKHDGKEYKAVKNLAVLMKIQEKHIVVPGMQCPVKSFLINQARRSAVQYCKKSRFGRHWIGYFLVLNEYS